MLKPRVLTEVLTQMTNNGIQSTVLLTRDGALLAYSGFESKDAKIIAAMASSIFAAHQRARVASSSTINVVAQSQNMMNSGDLQMILLDAEEGKMAIAAVATQLVCMVSKPSVQLGMLKAKMEALSSYLQEPLRQVSQATN